MTDLWPDALQYIDMNAFLKRILILSGHVFNSLIWPRIDTIVTHNDVMAHLLSKRSGRKIHIIYGVIDIEKFRPIPKYEVIRRMPKSLKKKIKKDDFILFYAGLLGPFQNPGIIVRLAQFIKDALFIVIGEGPLKEELIKNAEKLIRSRTTLNLVAKRVS